MAGVLLSEMIRGRGSVLAGALQVEGERHGVNRRGNGGSELSVRGHLG